MIGYKNPPNIAHLKRLIDKTGLIQHAHFTVPDPKHGYCLDDNARALVAVLKYHKLFDGKELIDLAGYFLSFIRYAESEGKFHNFLDYSREWKDESSYGDSYGRAIWALGFATANSSSAGLRESAKWLFDHSIWNSGFLFDLRAIAFTLMGTCFYFEATKQKTVLSLIEKLAEQLIKNFEKNKEEGWVWFENKLTYENARIPQSLLFAYQKLKKKKYLEIALASLNFLKEVQYDKKKEYFDIIGQKGWYPKNGKKAAFDQQPVEAGSLAETFAAAFAITKDPEYKFLAKAALDWFFGANILGVSLFDSESFGVRDGITAKGLNRNQGGESLVSYLLANLTCLELLK